MSTPATDWKETPAPGEGEQFEALAASLAALQRARAARTAVTRRGLHAKQTLAAHGRFEVVHGVPEHAQVGPLRPGAVFPALVRFSNGSGAVQEDVKPDVRGLAVKLFGVPGKKLIPGMEACLTQDFLGILTPAVPFRTPEEFVWVVTRSASPATFLPRALFHLGPGRTLALLGALRKGLGRPVPSLAASQYFSALPLRFGPLAAKFTFVPLDGGAVAGPTPPSLAEELAGRLRVGDVRWEFQVQFFADEASTPIEDPTVPWSTPFLPVARLVLPRQDCTSPRGERLLAWSDGLSFDPWHALEELRPLGAMMRSRSAAYRVSNLARGAASEPSELPGELLG
jgi:hypothetical protein